MGKKQRDTDRVDREEYLDALESASDDLSDSEIDALIAERLNVLGIDEISEAEQAAAAAEPPRKRVDGEAVGGGVKRRPLTKQQLDFVQGIVEGKSQRQAYKDAYPNASASSASIGASAQRLMKDPRIKRLIDEAWEETAEVLVEDVAATKRYLMKSLLHYAKHAKQDAIRLRALELMGKATGAFNDTRVEKEKPITAEQLRKELVGHLKLVDTQKTSKPKVA